jgi:outer membrane protein assembly factor BamD (BamD/ComL family)
MRAASRFLALSGAFLFTLSPLLPAQRLQSAPPPGAPPVYRVTGQVIMEDGSVPDQQVGIELVCAGVSSREGVADSKGRFTLVLGQWRDLDYDASRGPTGGSASALTADRAIPSGYGIDRLALCELRAQFSNYRSSSVSLGPLRQSDRLDVGFLVLYAKGERVGTMVSAHSLQAPKGARRLYEQGLRALQQKKWDEAQARLQKAVQEYPQYADAWFELGLLYHRQARSDEALAAYLEAARLDPLFVKPQFHLAVLNSEQSQWEEVAGYTARVIELDPASYAQAHYLDALANYQLGRLEAAASSARRARIVIPLAADPRLALLQANILVAQRDYKAAAQAYRDYLEAAPNAPNAASIRVAMKAAEERGQAAASEPQ